MIGLVCFYTHIHTLVFRTKVLQEHLEMRRQPELSSSDESDSECSWLSNQEIHSTQAGTSVTSETDRVGFSLKAEHEEFMKKQVALAKIYLERKRKLPTVSSKHSVEESPVSGVKKPNMEGRGPRTVPNSVKNHRRKLKKRRAKERARETGSNSIQKQE